MNDSEETKYPLDVPLTNGVFDAWLKGHVLEIEHVQLLLAKPLSDEPEVLVRQLTEVEAWGERINSIYADSLSFYYLAKRKALVARNDDYTDMDRDAIQRAEIVNQRRVRDTLEGIVDAIRTRTILGMILRKAHVAERPSDRMQENRNE